MGVTMEQKVNCPYCDSEHWEFVDNRYQRLIERNDTENHVQLGLENIGCRLDAICNEDRLTQLTESIVHSEARPCPISRNFFTDLLRSNRVWCGWGIFRNFEILPCVD